MYRRQRSCNVDDFFDTLYASDLASARRILACGETKKSPDICNHYGNTLLHKAVKNNHADKIEMFAQLGCNLNLLNTDGMTPLCDAVVVGNIEIVKALIEVGACVNHVQGQTLTPLQHAVGLNNFTVAKVLIQSGSNIDFPSALHVAIENESPYMVKFLLENGADVNCVEMTGFTSLALALLSQNKKIVQLLLQHNVDWRRECLLDLLVYTWEFWADERNAIWSMIAEATDLNDILPSDPTSESKNLPLCHSMHILETYTQCLFPLCLVTRYTDSLTCLKLLLEANVPLTWDADQHHAQHMQLPGANCGNIFWDSLWFRHDSALCYPLKYGQKNILTMLLYSGMDLTKVGECTRIRLYHAEEDVNIGRLVRKFLRNPLPLSVLSRNVIRECLGKGLKHKVAQLPIPKSTRQFVLLHDLFYR